MSAPPFRRHPSPRCGKSGNLLVQVDNRLTLPFTAFGRIKSGVHRVVIGFVVVGLAATSLSAIPSTTPASAPAPDLKRVSELSRRAVELIDRRDYAGAQVVLRQALELMPDEPICLYDLACVEAASGDAEAALSDLERAADAGFTNFNHLEHNPAFAALRDLPRFKQFLAREDEFRDRAAQRILAQLKSRFGPDYRYELDEPRKLIFAAHTDQATLDSLRRELRVEAESQWELLFSHKPDEFIRVIVATPHDFVRLERRQNIQGRYDDVSRTLLVKASAGLELRHEFTHALHAADQHALNQEHPVWLSEALACLYETPRIKRTNDELGERMLPNLTGRLRVIREAARHRNVVPLTGLLTLDRESFTSRANLTYPEAASLLFYLYEHHRLKKFYDTYTADYAHDPTGREALEKTMGMELPEIQKAWLDWLSDRPESGPNTGQ